MLTSPLPLSPPSPPFQVTVEVLGIMRVEEEVPAAFSGDNIKLKLRGVEEEVRRPCSNNCALCCMHNDTAECMLIVCVCGCVCATIPFVYELACMCLCVCKRVSLAL